MKLVTEDGRQSKFEFGLLSPLHTLHQEKLTTEKIVISHDRWPSSLKLNRVKVTHFGSHCYVKTNGIARSSFSWNINTNSISSVNLLDRLPYSVAEKPFGYRTLRHSLNINNDATFLGNCSKWYVLQITQKTFQPYCSLN